jgi:diamine N-acetyltransferase
LPGVPKGLDIPASEREEPEHETMTTTPDVRIRRATMADARVLAEFGARVFEETFGPHNTREDIALYVSSTYSPALQTSEIADAMSTYHVAEIDGRLAGYALMRTGPAPACVRTPRPLEIYRFYVDRRFHGAGVSRTLMDACIADAEARSATALWLGVWERNTRAIRFYEKCGFRDVGSQRFILGTDPQTDRVMMRESVG